MDFTGIKMNEAVNLAVADTGQEVYMLQRITSDTTIEALTTACGFVMKSVAKKPAKEAPKEKSKTVKKSEVDHGKIVALYTATPPRSVSWIADEIGCSQQTVINHLQREGIYKGANSERS